MSLTASIDADRLETYEEALQKIAQWAEAYPSDIFTDQDLKTARAALVAAGVSMDGLHGSWARYLMQGVGQIAKKALASSLFDEAAA